MTDNTGRVRVSDSYPYAGTYSALLDCSSNGTYSTVALVLTVDLSAQTDVDLAFWWREFSDENDPEDGVFISDDYGASWSQLTSFNNGPSEFIPALFDLSAAAADAGLSLNDHFQIKFQMYDNFSIPTDGYAVDEVSLWRPATPTPTPEGYLTPTPSPTSTPVPTVTPTPEGYHTPAPSPSPSPWYCSASGGCDEYISRVQFNTIDNASGCDGYGDYTAFSTVIVREAPYGITVTNPNTYSGDKCDVWVDWNHNRDFYDAGESTTLNGGPAVFTGTITAPAGALLGDARLRIRVRYYQSVEPCGDFNYGDVEDYTVVVAPPITPTPTVMPTPEICTRISEGFDGYDSGSRPSGWTFTGCALNSDTYTTAGNYGHLSPSIQLDETDDSVECASFVSGEWIQFWIKGQMIDITSHLLVEEFSTAWTTVTDIIPLPSTGTVFTGLPLNPSTSRVKFTYARSTGELALDDVLVKCLMTPSPSVTPTPTPVPSATPSPTVTSTPTPPPTLTPPPTPSPTLSPVPTRTPEPTLTPSATPTPSPSAPSGTPSPTCGPLLPPAGIVLASGDFDGDDTDDIAVFRPAAGLWGVRGVTRAYFGGVNDSPIPGDYNGDGKSEIGIFRDAAGLWAIRGVTRVYFGGPGDIASPDDYDGDGRTDIALFRESTGLWALRGLSRAYFGAGNDWPVPGDYSGSGTDSMAVFRPSSGLWAIRGGGRVYYGADGDWALPGDFDGDGSCEPAIFRACAGLWAIRGVTRSYHGRCTDYPVRADFGGTGIDSIGVFRGPAGLWAIKGVSRAYYGAAADLPVTR